MGRSKYVFLTNVKLVALKEKSVEVILDDERVYIPYSQIEETDLAKISKVLDGKHTKSDLAGHEIAVTEWWANTANVEYEEA